MPETPYILVRNERALAACLDDVSRQHVVGLDTETTGLDPFMSDVRLVQLATPSTVYVIDCFGVPALADPRFGALLAAERPVKILHNAKFDARMLEHHAGARLRGVFDSYLAGQLVAAGVSEGSNSLKAMAERYLGVAVDKGEQLSDWSGELSESQVEYAARDASVLLPLRERLVERIRALGLIETAKLEFDCAYSVARMENAGIFIDRARWSALCDTVERAHRILRDDLAEQFAGASLQMTLFGGASEINLDSPAQVQEALHRLGIPVEGTRAFQLQAFARDFPIVGKLLEYRGVSKQLTSYGRALLEHIHPKTGRVHPSFIQIGAPSGRFACMDPSVQQIPNAPEYRDCVRAPEGRQLVIADYSQVELRILADWSQDAALLKAFQSGEDLHRVTASQMFNVPLEEVSKKQRSAAKSLNFGLLYGMGAQGLANRIDTSVSEAEQLMKKYFGAYRGVERWLREAGEQAVREGKSRTRSGRLVLYKFDGNDRGQVAGIVRLGKNVPIQGCLGPDVRVHTDRGLWKIADLATRDCSGLRVFDGEKYVPFRAFPSGPKGAYRLTSADGWTVVASANHRFRIATPNGPIWKRTDELERGNLLMATREPVPGGDDDLKPYEYRKGHWRETYRSYRLPSVWTPTLAELVGALIGDGWYGRSVRRGALNIAVGEADYDVRDWYVDAWKEVFDCDAIVSERPADERRRPRSVVQVHSVQIRGFLDAQGLTRVVGEAKEIPEVLFQATADIRAAVLRGLYSTDGTVTPDQIPALHNTSRAVAIGARHLLASLGISSSVRRSPCSSGKTAYKVSVSRTDVDRFVALIGFRSARKQAQLTALKTLSKKFDRAPEWMVREVGQAGLKHSDWTPEERAHLRRLSEGSGSIPPLVKFRDRIEENWNTPGLDRAETYRYVPVVSVESTGEEIEMYDVEVFDDGHRFVADGFITHNSSADITKRAMTLLDEALVGVDARIVNSIHDELVVECDAVIADDVRERVEQAMRAAGQEYIKSIPVVVETTVSQSWVK